MAENNPIIKNVVYDTDNADNAVIKLLCENWVKYCQWAGAIYTVWDNTSHVFIRLHGGIVVASQWEGPALEQMRGFSPTVLKHASQVNWYLWIPPRCLLYVCGPSTDWRAVQGVPHLSNPMTPEGI